MLTDVDNIDLRNMLNKYYINILLRISISL